MPPKKREKDADSTKNPRNDHMQADHELFLQAFEKPTQIYRYLRTRNVCSPIFLNRTLGYMKHRMSRSNKTRLNFKINSLLERVTSQQKLCPLGTARFMNITFLGLYDKTFDLNVTSAQVEACLLKISYKKRKDSSAQMVQVSLGFAEVVINPSENSLPPTVPSINISSDSFTVPRGPLVKSHILLLKARCFTSQSDAGDNEPLTKRRKSVHTSNNRALDDSKLYGSELVVYDKLNRCLLTDGDYEIHLTELTNSTKSSPKKHAGWENASDLGDAYNNLEPVKYPFLKLRLTWSQEPLSRFVERPIPFVVGENKENVVVANSENGQLRKLQIVYQFVYNNNSRQQTEACEDSYCPWCSLNCSDLPTLLKHLRMCHPRFTFKVVKIASGARIDVAINELFDGSYSGSPHDLIMQPNVCAFSRDGPVRRTSVTNILVCHPKRTSKPSLSEFLEQEDCDFDGQRPFITGHNRLYHHTTTCLPIYPKEMDLDSEGEYDPEWLQTKTRMMIDEFTDVNEGEKELMKMWNLHVMKYGFVGNCQIPLACLMFLQCKGDELLLKKLYKNFCVHLCNLFDYGLITPAYCYHTMLKLQQLVVGLKHKLLRESHETQRKKWKKTFTGINQTKEKYDPLRSPVVRKTANMGLQRRKGTPATSEASTRRKSLAGEVHSKRLTSALNKSVQ